MYDQEKIDPSTLESYRKPHAIPPFAYVLVGIIVTMFVLSMFPSGVSVMEDKPSPELRLRNLVGDLKVLEPENGKIKVLDFWATWCGPCFTQTPSFLRLERENNDVEVWSVNTDAPGANRRAKIEGFMRRGGWNFDVVLDNGRVSESFNVAAYPSIVVIGMDGKITYAASGTHSYEQLMEQVNKARKR